jgi:hypothetical protein
MLFVVTLALLVLVLLLSFVGCQLIFPIDEPSEATLVIDDSCAGVTDVAVQLDGDLEVGQHFLTTISTVPSGGMVISTADFQMEYEDVGKVYCMVTVGFGTENAVQVNAAHDKLEDETVSAFSLSRQDDTFKLT